MELWIFLLTAFALLDLGPCERSEKQLEQEVLDLLKNQEAARAEENSGHFEGDIEMDEGMQRALTSDRLSSRDAVISPTYHWPDGKIYYSFHESLGYFVRIRIQQAFDHIEKHTCIRFREHRNDPNTHFVMFFRGHGCYSRVGRSPTKYMQKISIGHGCERLGTIVHESMHALGFFHEHTRPDRDKFVRIKWSEIVKKHKRNFQKYPRYLGSDLGKPYDYLSVMHYSKYAFAKNGLPTIIPKERAIIGQRLGLSHYDAYQINKLYNCEDEARCKDSLDPYFCEMAKKRNACSLKKCRRDCMRTCGYCGS